MIKINLTAPINKLGYGVAGNNIALALDRHKDVNVALLPIMNRVEYLNDNDRAKIEYLVEKGRLFHKDGHSIRLWHQFALAEHVGNGQKIGFPVFELDKFTIYEKHHLEAQDKIFVCSNWAKDILSDELEYDGSIHVIPLGVNTDIFHFRDNTDHVDTVFLNIGKWEKRKGHDVLIEAFNRAFEPDDPVMLVMATSNPFLNAEQSKKWEDLYKKSKMGKKVELIGRLDTQEDISRIMSMCDCGVFPSRGEGWNLELLECMACGLTVITTNYSAHTEFCNNQNAYLVDINKLESAYDGIWFHNQGNWAHIGDHEIEQFAEYMRYVHKQKQTYNKLVNHYGVDTSNKFSWENTANQIVRSINI